MTQAPLPELSARHYTPPRLIRPQAARLSPEGKAGMYPAEAIYTQEYGPS